MMMMTMNDDVYDDDGAEDADEDGNADGVMMIMMMAWSSARKTACGMQICLPHILDNQISCSADQPDK